MKQNKKRPYITPTQTIIECDSIQPLATSEQFSVRSYSDADSSDWGSGSEEND